MSRQEAPAIVRRRLEVLEAAHEVWVAGGDLTIPDWAGTLADELGL